MATSALVRNSRRLRISPFILNIASVEEFTKSASSAALVQRSSHYRWAPTTVLGNKEGAEQTRSVNVALGVFGSVSLAMLCLKALCEDSVRCDGAQLQNAVSEEINGSPVAANKAYNLLAGWFFFWVPAFDFFS